MVKKKKIILLLTSYGKRIDTVYLTIQTLLNQTKKADKIVLWLAEDEFSLETIPASLKSLVDEGKLEVGFCKDIRSYKKLVPSLKKYPDDIIITFDDDIFYKNDIVEKLYNAYLKEPELLHCMRGRMMKYNSKGDLLSYKKWKKFPLYFKADINILPTTGAGTLFVKEYFDEDVFRDDVFMKLAPNADDVWFKAMTMKNGVKCKLIKRRFWHSTKLNNIDGTQEGGLWELNRNIYEGNNPQIKAVFEKYGICKMVDIPKKK